MKHKLNHLGVWLMLCLSVSGILAPTASLATTVDEKPKTEETTESSLPSMTKSEEIPALSETKESESDVPTSEQSETVASSAQDVEPKKTEKEVIEATNSIDEQEFSIHEDSTNPQPSIKEEVIDTKDNKVSVSGILFAGKEVSEEMNSQTIVTYFALQSQLEGQGQWETEKEWVTKDKDSKNVTEKDYSYESSLEKPDGNYRFRYVMIYHVDTLDTDQTVIKEVHQQGFITPSEIFEIKKKEDIMKSEETLKDQEKETTDVSESKDSSKDEIKNDKPGSSITDKEVSEKPSELKEQDKQEVKEPSVNLPDEQPDFNYSKLNNRFAPFALGVADGDTPITGSNKNNIRMKVVPGDGKLTLVFKWEDLPAAQQKARYIYPRFEIRLNGGLLADRNSTISDLMWFQDLVPSFGGGYEGRTVLASNGTWSYEITGLTNGANYTIEAYSPETYFNGAQWQSDLVPPGGKVAGIEWNATGTPEKPEVKFQNEGINLTASGNGLYASAPYSVTGANENLGSAKMVFSQNVNDAITGNAAPGKTPIKANAGFNYLYWTEENLTPGATYYVRFYLGTDRAGVEAWSNILSITIPSIKFNPGSWVLTSAGNGFYASAPLTWSGCTINQSSGRMIASIHKSWVASGQGEIDIPANFATMGFSYLEATANNLTPGQTYYIRFQASSNEYSGIKAWSDIIEITIPSIKFSGEDFSIRSSGTEFYASAPYTENNCSINLSGAKMYVSKERNDLLAGTGTSIKTAGKGNAGFDFLYGTESGLTPGETYYVRFYAPSNYSGISGWSTIQKIVIPEIKFETEGISLTATEDGFYASAPYKEYNCSIDLTGTKMYASENMSDLVNGTGTIIKTPIKGNFGFDYLHWTENGLSPGKTYYVRFYAPTNYSDIKGWSAILKITLPYYVTEGYYDLTGTHIKDNSVKVTSGSYTSVPQPSFTYNSQPYIYQGWLKESEWDGNSGTPMPALHTGAVDPMNTHGQKVYLIYDIDNSALRLDEHPRSFNFGNKHTPFSYTQAFGLDASKYSSTEPTDGFKVRVRDDRSLHPGWKLTSSLSTMDGNLPLSDQLVGAQIRFAVELKEIQNPGTPGETAGAPGVNAPTFGSAVSGTTANLTADGSTHTFLTAANTKGEGTWDVLIDFSSVQLIVPGGQGITGESYQSTIQWDLEDAP